MHQLPPFPTEQKQVDENKQTISTEQATWEDNFQGQTINFVHSQHAHTLMKCFCVTYRSLLYYHSFFVFVGILLFFFASVNCSPSMTRALYRERIITGKRLPNSAFLISCALHISQNNIFTSSLCCHRDWALQNISDYGCLFQ